MRCFPAAWLVGLALVSAKEIEEGMKTNEEQRKTSDEQMKTALDYLTYVFK